MSLVMWPTVCADDTRDAGLLIGLLIPDVQNDFYSRISKELADRCRRVGLRMLLAISEDDPFTEQNEIRALAEARVNGVIATLTSQPQPASLAMLKEMPTVQLVRHVKNFKKAAVCMEDQAGARRPRNICWHSATAAWLHRHHRSDQQRARPGTRILKRAQGAQNFSAGWWRRTRAPRQSYGYDGVARLLSLKQRPTALVIGSSELTIGALSALRKAGLLIRTIFPSSATAIRSGSNCSRRR